MTRSMLNKFVGRPLLLASAAYLLNVGDAQAQARELLTGGEGRAVAARSRPVISTQTSGPAVTPQEQARRLILGAPRVETKTTSPSDAARRRIRGVYSDPQLLAERMILGRNG